MALVSDVSRRNFISLAGSAVTGCCCGSPLLTAEPPADEYVPNLWGNGQLLAFSGLDGATDYQNGLVARTTDVPPGISIVLPVPAQIFFASRSSGPVQLSSDTFQLPTGKGLVRGALADAHHLLIEGPCEIRDLAPGLNKATRGAITLIGSRQHFDTSLLDCDLSSLMRRRQAWLKQNVPAHILPEQRRRTLCKAISTMKGQVNTPEGLIRHRWTTPDRWPHRDLWLWDSVCHSFGWRHLDPVLAREMVEAVFDGQQPDGRIPHQLSPFKTSAVTQPPLLAFGVRNLALLPRDLDWINRCYTPLTRYLEWDLEHRIGPGEGLAHWFIDPDPLSRSGESGMDNSPRFDSATRLLATDLNAFLSMECVIMASFAQALKKPEDAHKWTDRHRNLNRLIGERLWNEKAGFYFDYDPVAKQQTGVFAVSGFLPLLCGAAQPHQVERLAAHLQNPSTFGTAVPLPSAVIEPGLRQSHDMWRGPMWVNTNWLVARGFATSGRADLARKLREATMREIERRYLELGSLFEFYDEFGAVPPDRLPRKGRLEPMSAFHQAVHDYGWTACLYADMVLSPHESVL
ncbi:MAG: trehalase family glycosidase [Terracidiphilus sp.]|nr:trehalase family glycosidase [Terracidiphilus sp.]